jgi:hypothetical protein
MGNLRRVPNVESFASGEAAARVVLSCLTIQPDF